MRMVRRGRLTIGPGQRPPGGADVWLVRYDPAVRQVAVKRGENRGQIVRERNVVRQLVRLGAWSGRQKTYPAPADGPVILAVPPWVAQELVPDLTAPDAFRAIVNGHFRVRSEGEPARIIGVLNGTVEWIFRFEDRISVTVSGANRLMGVGREELAQQFWADVSLALGLDTDLPPWQIVKEKRATFAATPAVDAIRPHAKAPGLSNLVLAGDWTQTGLPATIEGALRSGETAAALLS